MKIAITGAGGFLGANVTRYFVAHPQVTHVRALYLNPAEVPPQTPKLEALVGDLTQDGVAEKLVEDTNIVFHFAHAGCAGDGHLNPVQTVSQNLKMAGAVLEAMKKKNVNRFIYISSADGLYKFDPFKRVPHHELSEIEYRSAYAISKISTEHLVLYYQQTQGIQATIFRPSCVYGKQEVAPIQQSLISYVFSQVKKLEPVILRGGLENYKDYLYIDDFSRAMGLVLPKKDLTGLFNIGSGMGTSVREIITTAERVTGLKIKTEIQERSPFDSTWTILNTHKIQRSLSWSCHFSLLEGMRATWSAMHPPQTKEVKKVA